MSECSDVNESFLSLLTILGVSESKREELTKILTENEKLNHLITGRRQSLFLFFLRTSAYLTY